MPVTRDIIILIIIIIIIIIIINFRNVRALRALYVATGFLFTKSFCKFVKKKNI